MAMVVTAVAALFFLSEASAYTAQDVANGGTLSGKISFSGKVPESTKIPIEKNPEVCGTGVREVKEVSVDGKGGLEDAVVFFEKVAAGKPWSTPDGGWKLNQKTCRFLPWVQVIEDKSELEVINQDPVLHNIHTYELIPAGKRIVRVTMFNEAQPTQGYTFKKKIRMRRGKTVKIECDAHNFMHAYMVALKNPYYAITTADGAYSIDNIPAGKYKVTVWHSKLGTMSKQVEIGAGGKATLSHDYK
jgi:hypothetical protein